MPLPNHASGRDSHTQGRCAIFRGALKDLLKFRLLGAQPKNAVIEVRNALNQKLLNRKAGIENDPRLLLLKIKQRYAKIDMSGNNAQWKEVATMLDALRHSGKPVLVFYSTENPEVEAKIASRPDMLRMRTSVAEAVSAGGNVVYLPPLEALKKEHFIDNFHLTPEGTRILGDAAAAALLVPLRERQPAGASR